MLYLLFYGERSLYLVSMNWCVTNHASKPWFNVVREKILSKYVKSNELEIKRVYKELFVEIDQESCAFNWAPTSL